MGFLRYPIKSGIEWRGENTFIQGIFSSGNGGKSFPIAFPNAVLGVALSIGHGASDPAFYSALTTSSVTITDAKGAVSIIAVGY